MRNVASFSQFYRVGESSVCFDTKIVLFRSEGSKKAAFTPGIFAR
jgi:hypothetical protein